jgi:hypothetical protein
VNCLPDWDDSAYWYWYKDVVSEAIAIKKASQPKTKPIAGHIDVDAIKERIDLVTVVENYGIKIKKAGNSWRGMCPFHTGITPALAVYPDEKSWWCYACNFGGSVIDFIMRIDNLDFKTAAAKAGEIL